MILKAENTDNQSVIFRFFCIFRYVSLLRAFTMWKDFFYYTRGQRRAAVFLLLLMILILGIRIRPFLNAGSEQPFMRTDTDTFFFAWCDSFYRQLQERPVSRRFPGRRNDSVFSEPVLFPFDPNTADSATLVSLGLSGYATRNIMRYRKKGGVFRRPEKLGEIYGIDSLLFGRLRSYIRIDTTLFPVRKRDSLSKTPLYTPVAKFDSGVTVELNSADTLLLARIPGIGKGFAARIIRYREELGGYYSVEQLRELVGVSDTVYARWAPWLVADRSLIRPLSVNKSGVVKLRNHPYLNFYQARILYELRRERGRLKGWEDLFLLEEFTEEDLTRLRPYLIFE